MDTIVLTKDSELIDLLMGFIKSQPDVITHHRSSIKVDLVYLVGRMWAIGKKKDFRYGVNHEEAMRLYEMVKNADVEDGDKRGMLGYVNNLNLRR